MKKQNINAGTLQTTNKSNVLKRHAWFNHTATAILMSSSAFGIFAATFMHGASTASPNVKPTVAATIAPARGSAQSGDHKDGVQVEIITLRHWGFEPNEVTRPHSNLVLRVDNRSGLEEMSIDIEREAGEKVKEVRGLGGKRDWVEGVDLPPGRYVLSEADHPEWVCRITITPR